MKARKTRAFLIETLVLVFLFLLTLTVLVQLYGAAARESQSAERRTQATLIAQNAATAFSLGDGALGEAIAALEPGQTQEVDLTYADTGLMDEAGDYRVRVRLGCEERLGGEFVTADIFVAYGEEEEASATLDTGRYFPDYEMQILTLREGEESTGLDLSDALGEAGTEEEFMLDAGDEVTVEDGSDEEEEGMLGPDAADDEEEGMLGPDAGDDAADEGVLDADDDAEGGVLDGDADEGVPDADDDADGGVLDADADEGVLNDDDEAGEVG